MSPSSDAYFPTAKNVAGTPWECRNRPSSAVLGPGSSSSPSLRPGPSSYVKQSMPGGSLSPTILISRNIGMSLQQAQSALNLKGQGPSPRHRPREAAQALGQRPPGLPIPWAMPCRQQRLAERDEDGPAQPGEPDRISGDRTTASRGVPPCRGMMVNDQLGHIAEPP